MIAVSRFSGLSVKARNNRAGPVDWWVSRWPNRYVIGSAFTVLCRCIPNELVCVLPEFTPWEEPPGQQGSPEKKL